MKKIKQILKHKQADSNGWKVLTSLIESAELSDKQLYDVQIALGIPVNHQIALESEQKESEQ